MQSARTRTRPISAWGFAPELIVTQACGLLLLAAVNTAGRFAYPWALDLFYVGLIVIYAPTFFRMLLPTVSRRERVALVVATGLSLYMVKVLHSPASFTLHDELLHWKTVDSIRQSGYLFKENPLLPVSPLYPGLHLLTVALSEMLGIGTFGAGVLLLGMIRIVLAVALFSLLEYTTDSPQIAGLGTLIYMCNSNFVFFLSQYAYESVALPLGLLLLVLLFRRHTLSALPRLVVNVCVLALLFSIVATHHVTTYMMLAFLAGSVFVYTTWARIEPLIRRIADWVETWWIYRRVARTFIPYSPEDAAIFGKVQPQHMFFWTALLLAIASLAWMLYVATPTLGYLTPVFSEAFRELVNIIRQENASRQLFASEGGNIRPLWERLTAVGAVLLSVIAFPYGVIEVWRRYRNRTGTILLAFAAGMYFVTLSFRFTEKGWELSNRSSEFLFVGLGFIIALAIVARLRYHDYQAIWIWVFAVGGTILLIGGLLAGWAYWARIPGPYMVGADTRSIEEQGLIAAGWTQQYLPPDSRLVADRINGLLMGAYGRQYIIRSGTNNIQIAPVLFSLTLGEWEYNLLNMTDAQYAVVDYRLTRELPELGVFVEVGEPGGNQHRSPIAEVALDKFNKLPNVSRIYDAGNIRIYEIQALSESQALSDVR